MGSVIGNRLKWAGLVEENPVELEMLGGLRCKGLHAEDFGRVVTAGIEVES